MHSDARPARILAVDDDQKILDAYVSIFSTNSPDGYIQTELEQLDRKLFDISLPEVEETPYEITTCLNGKDAISAVRDSSKVDIPYEIAFVDMRMPPGLNGLQTAKEIRALDANINIVIVTAYSDVDPAEIAKEVSPADKLFYVKKPFHKQEVEQFARALSAKWLAENTLSSYNDELESKIFQRTKDLETAYAALEAENEWRRKIAESLKEAEEDLHKKAKDLNDTNTTLTVLLRKTEEDRKEFENTILYNIQEIISPYLTKLINSPLTKNQASLAKIIEMNLKEILTPFMRDLSYRHFQFTPQEIQIANLVKLNKSSKEIAAHLNISTRTVEFYRDKIRDKLGIKNSKTNLRKLLLDMASKFETR